jgi:hypothetical protein
MNKARLEELKGLVREEALKGRFDMAEFLTVRNASPLEDGETYLEWRARLYEECGTSACLAGLACVRWKEELGTKEV